MKRIVVLGAGFAGVAAVKSLLKDLPRGYEVVLVNKSAKFNFKPLLHEVATGAFSDNVACEDIPSSFRHPRFAFVKGVASGVDLKRREVSVGRHKLAYNFLLLAFGSEPNYFHISGAKKYSLPLSTVEDAYAIKKALADVAKRDKPRIFIIGGGALGIELSTEVAEFMDALNRKRLIIVVNRDAEILPSVSRKFRDKVEIAMYKRRVHLLQDTSVVKVGKNFVATDSGEKLPADLVIWAAGVRPSSVRISPKFGLPRGFFPVDSHLNLRDFPNVFAIGDCALLLNQDGFPVPQLAQSAVDEGKFVAKNILALIRKQPLQNYGFDSRGFILPLGKGYAVAEVKGRAFSGFFAWWLNRTVYLLQMLTLRHRIYVIANWTVGLFSRRKQ